MTGWRILSTCGWLVLCICVQTTRAQTNGQDANPESVAGRWQEQAYGMSLDMPADSTYAQQTADGALIEFYTPDPATISIFIRRSEDQLTLEGVKEKAQGELSFRHPSAVTLAQDSEPVTVAERDALGLYLLIPDEKQGDWVFAQVYTMIDPTTVAIYQFSCSSTDLDASLTTFLGIINSVGFAAPAELDRLRTERIEAGRAWLESISSEQLKSASITEQWFRITVAGKDTGYMRVRHHDEADHVPPGTSVAIQSRLIEGDKTYDSEGKFFESEDRSEEFWTITTTLKLPPTTAYNPDAPPQPMTQNWRQTGLRDGLAMEVSHETPTNIKKYSWNVPPGTYLSQVNQYILPALLPHDKAQTLAFYAFDQDTRKLSLRTYQVQPMPGGTYRVFERPTPDQPQQVATYSPTGRLIERRLPDGRVILATTPQELKRIWGAL